MDLALVGYTVAFFIALGSVLIYYAIDAKNYRKNRKY